MTLLHGRYRERAVTTDLDGGVGVNALVVVVPSEKWGRVSRNNHVQDDILALTHFQVSGEIVNGRLKASWITA